MTPQSRGVLLHRELRRPGLLAERVVAITCLRAHEEDELFLLFGLGHCSGTGKGTRRRERVASAHRGSSRPRLEPEGHDRSEPLEWQKRVLVVRIRCQDRGAFQPEPQRPPQPDPPQDSALELGASPRPDLRGRLGVEKIWARPRRNGPNQGYAPRLDSPSLLPLLYRSAAVPDLSAWSSPFPHHASG